MKNACLILIALVCQALPAMASEDFFFNPYIGADYQYVGASYQNIPTTTTSYGDFVSDSFHGAHAHIGARIHKNFGIEAGYLWTAKSDKSNSGISTKANVEGATIDGMGYIPVSEKFEMIGTIGLSYLTANVKLTAGSLAGAGDESEVGFRFGTGGQYWLTDHINVRGLIRYQTADFKNVLSDAVDINAGLNYQF